MSQEPDPDLDGTRERIVLTAARIVSSEPFEALTMRRVASDANVSLSTVVRHFGTKDALLAALVELGEAESPHRRAATRPGDVGAAVRAVVDDYESDGDSLLNVLAQEHRFPAVARLLDIGRNGHLEWIRTAFAPQLRGLRGARLRRTEGLLVVATDVYTWKILRRDRRLSRGETCASMTQLVNAAVAQ
jgi:AcrR family transcriptional regulator